jgi:hypothetical protein
MRKTGAARQCCPGQTVGLVTHRNGQVCHYIGGEAGTITEAATVEDVSRAIAALEDERYAAMLSGDRATLDRLLDDRLRHVHSSGYVDSKTSYMNDFGRRWQYRSIERRDQIIVPLNDSALVFNTLHIDVQVADGLRKVDARALTVWTMSGGAWRVVAFFLAANSLATTPIAT